MYEITEDDYLRTAACITASSGDEGSFEVVFSFPDCDITIRGWLETSFRDSLGDGFATPREWIEEYRLSVLSWSCCDEQGRDTPTDFCPERLEELFPVTASHVYSHPVGRRWKNM